MIKSFFCYRLSIWAFLLLMNGVVFGQSNFLYIQSENSQPYNLVWKGNTYGSTGKGYLFIPQLANGTHTITVSFPGDKYGEYSFSFVVADKPKGFVLRVNQEGEWMLMDMVTTELLRGTVTAAPVKNSGDKQIQKLNEKSGEQGVDQRFAVKNGNQVDTVALFIPNIVAKPAAKPVPGAGGSSLQKVVRLAEKAEKAERSAEKAERAANKVKIPLVPEAYGSGSRPKQVKQ